MKTNKKEELCLVKKLTVIGIIGKTQGVKSAANPLTNDKKKITSRRPNNK